VPETANPDFRETPIAAVDQGSTGTKAALIDAAGRHLVESSRPVERFTVGTSIEQDPESLAASVEACLEEVARNERPAAIGLTCQRSTCLVWERQSGRPLTRALSWQDVSETSRVESLAAHADEVAARTGLHLSPHYAASKLSRLLDEVPDGRRRAADGELVAGTLDAFLAQRLTGEATSEPGHAGRTLLYNLETGDWDPALCDLFGVPRAALPRLLASAEPRGDWHGLPLVATAGDQQAALLGHGGWRRGVVAAHFGTGAFVLASCGDAPLRHPGLLAAVLASTPERQRFQLEGSVNSAGSAVDWACRLTGERLEEWGSRGLDPRRLPHVTPAFAGLGAPWWRPAAAAAITGLRLEHDGAALLGGVLAGVAQRVIDCVEAIAGAGVALETLRVSGKLTRLRGLVALLADLGQLPVEVAAEEETGLTGIARLAVAALGGDMKPLERPAASSRVVMPTWQPADADAVRRTWLSHLDDGREVRR
jgi:glycerol kinase